MNPKFTLGTTFVGLWMLVVWGVIPTMAALVSPDAVGLGGPGELTGFLAMGGVFIVAGFGLIRKKLWAWWVSVAWLSFLSLIGVVGSIVLIAGYSTAAGWVILITFSLFFGGALAILLALPSLLVENLPLDSESSRVTTANINF